MKAFASMLAIAAVVALVGCATQPQGVGQAGVYGMPPAGMAAGQTPAVSTQLGVPGNLAGVPGVASRAPSLTDILVQQLRITPEQAAGGAGSIFATAQQTMSPTDFAKVSQAVPGMNQYLAAAPSQASLGTGAAGALGAAGSALGAAGSGLNKAAALASSFQSLGLQSGMVNQFIPVILQYVQTQAGNVTMSLLQRALVP